MSEDLLKALLGAAMSQSGGNKSSQDDPLASMLGSLMGGAGSQQQPAEQSQADPLASMLGSLMGGAAQQQQAPAPAGDDALASMLGSLMGGGAQQQQAPASTGGDALGSILGSLMGGTAAQPTDQAVQGGDQLGSLLQVLLGGGAGSGVQASPGGAQTGILGSVLQPILTQLAQNLGIPNQIAQLIVNFALSTLLTGKVGGATAAAAQAPALDLGGLFGKMMSGQVISSNYLQATGMTRALVQESGLDQRTATLGLQQTLGALGGIMASQGASA